MHVYRYVLIGLNPGKQMAAHGEELEKSYYQLQGIAVKDPVVQ